MSYYSYPKRDRLFKLKQCRKNTISDIKVVDKKYESSRPHTASIVYIHNM